MLDASRRPNGRLFYWLLAVMVAALPRAFAAPSSPALTTVADTVYMADGTAAAGAVIITWPAFVTGSGNSIAAGTTNVTLGPNGALSVALAPNAGSNPAGVYYTVVYQLQAGEVRTEYWVVPVATTAVNLATVRTTPGSGTATQPVSIEYVNTALAAKANDNSVVHLSGSETISGTKTFAAAPSVPTPQNTGDVANKAYVDSALSNVGAGNFFPAAAAAVY
jgi:trimeric autotransporter adhesin